jgi:4-amino-4-deoxy-L-arabinose transferase-like glycosyltransferase
MARPKKKRKKRQQAPEQDSKSTDAPDLGGEESPKSAPKPLPWHLIQLGLVVLFAIVVRWQLREIPFERDEGLYAYFGHLLLDGAKPYIDFYEMKLPGLYYCYAIAIAIFGYSHSGIHIAFIVVNIVSILCIYETARRLMDKAAGVIAAASFALLSLSPHLSGFTAQSEHLVAMFTAAALLLMVMCVQTDKLVLALVCGLVMACGLFVKQTALFLAFFVGLGIIGRDLLQRPCNWRGAVQKGALYIAGLVIVGGGWCLLMLANGAFEQFTYWAWDYPRQYVSGIPFEQGKKLFGMVLARGTDSYRLLWLCAGAGLILPLFTGQERYLKVLVWPMTGLSLLTIVPGMRFYGHYWLQMLPALSLLVAIAMHSLYLIWSKPVSGKQNQMQTFWRAARQLAAVLTAIALIWKKLPPKELARRVTVAIFALIALANVYAQRSYYFSPDHSRILRAVYGSNPFPESKVIGDYIKADAGEDASIVLIGSEPQVYVYSGCDTPTKHAYFNHLVKNAEKVPHTAQWQEEFVADMEAAVPDYLVFFRHNISIMRSPGSPETVFKWLTPFWNKHYELVGLADMWSNGTQYFWGEDSRKNKPRSQSFIYVFKRKSP